MKATVINPDDAVRVLKTQAQIDGVAYGIMPSVVGYTIQPLSDCDPSLVVASCVPRPDQAGGAP